VQLPVVRFESHFTVGWPPSAGAKMGPSTLSSWALLIARTLRAKGIDAENVFRRARLDPGLLEDPNSRYPLAAMQRLWALAAEAANDRCIGLEVGGAWHPTTFHALGYVALASGTLREALGYVSRYCRVVTSGADIELVDEGEEAAVRLASKLPDYSIDAAIAAPLLAGLAALTVLCREVKQPLALRRVRLTSSDTHCRERLEAFFGCPLQLGEKDDAIVFSAADMDAPLPTANPALRGINEQLVTQYHAKLDSAHVSDRVRAHLSRSLASGAINEAVVARALNLSLRSMQRKLRQEGMSFRRLLDDTRRGLAAQYGQDKTLSTSEIAYLLGFAEVSSLSRAMRRWGTAARAKPFARISTRAGA
jgi:AraC-like DNA-binding protein